VRFLGLFDAVDRSPDLRNAEALPANIRTCRHALRDRATPNRTWFGNTGRTHGQRTDHAEATFWASHGAIGGSFAEKLSLGGVGGPNTLFTPPFPDRMQAQRVWPWMRAQAVAAGVPF
jgi:hypothetical protein